MPDTTTDPTGLPPGVPNWIDLVQPDFDRTTAFYGGLFGWTFDVRTPPGAPAVYAYAQLDGQLVAGVGSATGEGARSGWTNYVCVDSADDTFAAATENGGTALSAPMDIPRSGRVATVADPEGAVIGLWQPGENRGVQLVNMPGTWNFSDLHVADTDKAKAFYGAVFGWECDRLDFGTGAPTWLWRMPGYGTFLMARDPEMADRLAESEAPDGFADAVAWMQVLDPDGGSGPHWTVTFAVADADEAMGRAVELGAEVVTPLFDTEYTRQGDVRDPQGALLTLSEYRPPS